MHQPWSPWGGEFPTVRLSFVPRVGGWWASPCGIMRLFLVFPPIPWLLGGAQRGSQGRQSLYPLGAHPGASDAPSPKEPRPLPCGSSSLPGGFALCSDPPRSCPSPHRACTVVPAIVSLWLLIGHPPPVSSFCEGKSPEAPAAPGTRLCPWSPWHQGLGKGLAFLYFSLFFFECVFLWSGLWSDFAFGF